MKWNTRLHMATLHEHWDAWACPSRIVKGQSEDLQGCVNTINGSKYHMAITSSNYE